MRDISPNGSDLFFKPLGPGEDLHRMRIVLTVDADLVIRAIQVRTEAAPTPWCAESNAIYDTLVGLKIGPGFTRKVRALVGGAKGCTHLTELMGPAATTAMQTLFALGRERGGLRARHAAARLAATAGARQHLPGVPRRRQGARGDLAAAPARAARAGLGFQRGAGSPSRKSMALRHHASST